MHTAKYTPILHTVLMVSMPFYVVCSLDKEKELYGGKLDSDATVDTTLADKVRRISACMHLTYMETLQSIP